MTTSSWPSLLKSPQAAEVAPGIGFARSPHLSMTSVKCPLPSLRKSFALPGLRHEQVRMAIAVVIDERRSASSCVERNSGVGLQLEALARVDEQQARAGTEQKVRPAIAIDVGDRQRFAACRAAEAVWPEAPRNRDINKRLAGTGVLKETQSVERGRDQNVRLAVAVGINPATAVAPVTSRGSIAPSRRGTGPLPRLVNSFGPSTWRATDPACRRRCNRPTRPRERRP